MEWNDRVVMDLRDDRRCLISFPRKRLDECRKLSSWTRVDSIYFCNWVFIDTPVCGGGTRVKHLDVGALTSAIRNQSIRCRSRLQAIIAFRRWEYVWKASRWSAREKTRFDHDFIATQWQWNRISDADVKFTFAASVRKVTTIWFLWKSREGNERECR